MRAEVNDQIEGIYGMPPPGESEFALKLLAKVAVSLKAVKTIRI